MAVTDNYSLTLPTVAGDTDAWGGELNADLVAIDAAMKAISDVASAAVPVSGTGMVGRLDLFTSTMVHVDLGPTNAPALNFANGNSFSFTPSAGYAPVISNVPVGTSPILLVPLLLEVINGGAFAPTWPTAFKFPSGSIPSLTTSGRDIMAFVCRDGTNFRFLGISKNV